MKSYTNIPQSKKLAKILPRENADMHYERVYFEGKQSDWFVKLGTPIKSDDIIPCWSLAVLFELLPKEINVLGTIYSINIHTNNKKWSIDYKCNNEEFVGVYSSSLVDACVKMILKLKELNLL